MSNQQPANSTNSVVTVPNFDDLIGRADEEMLQRILGRPAVRLMQMTLNQDFTIERMRSALQGTRTAYDLLEDASVRMLILELLRPAESAELSRAVYGTSVPAIPFGDELKPNSDKFRKLLDSLGVALPPTEMGVEREQSTVACRPIHSLFPHQLKAMREVVSSLEQHPHRVMLHMPTGAGKTRTAMHVVAHYLRREDTSVVWLATSEELCEQAAKEFETTWKTCGDQEATLVRMWGPHNITRSHLESNGPQFIVAGLAKLHATRGANQTLLPRLGDRVSLIVFDEAHQSIADTYKAVVDVLLARNVNPRLLGLTATPGRSWNDVAADWELSDYFGGIKVTLTVPGYSSPVDYLIDDGFLARPTFRQVKHHFKGELSSADSRKLASSLDVPEELRMRLATDDYRNLLIIRECEHLIERHSRILVFAATVSHAELIAVALRGLGIAAYSISSKTKSSDRSSYIEWYREGEAQPRVLVNYGILATGFDAPQTSAALIARPTKSLVLYSQMIGRAMRGIRAGGNSSAEIVTVVDTSLPGFGNPADAFLNWEDVW